MKATYKQAVFTKDGRLRIETNEGVQLTLSQDCWQRATDELNRHLYDPTPWCHQCGAMEPEDCPCGPRAEND